MKLLIQNTSLWILLRTTLEEWTADNASRLAASLAYYTVFSTAPLLVIAVGIAGTVFGREAAQGELVGQIEEFLNNREVATLIEGTIRSAAISNASPMATAIGVALLLWGATGVFGELKNALNHVWDVPPGPGGIRGAVIHRLLTLAMVLVSGFLLFLSLIASTLVAAATDWINSYWWPGLGAWGQVINFVFFFLVTLVVFGLIYKFVPDVRLAWRDVAAGAVATALLFSIGRQLISVYLGYSTVGSTWGAAGALAVLLIWVYYSAQIFFLGAEFTQVYARTYGSRRREHVLLEQTAPGGALPTVRQEVDTILPAVHVVDSVPPEVPPRERARWRRILQPVATVGAAFGVIAALSIFNLVTRPNRE